MQSSIKHVAIIMDGNGRWATQRRRPRLWGHVRGASIVSDIVEASDNLGVKALTLYAFSTENWSRPLDEVTGLVKILNKFLIKERQRLIKNKVAFKVIGDTSHLNSEIKKLIQDLEHETKNFEGLKLSFAFSYGARKEIVDSINSWIVKHPNQLMTEQDFANGLYRPETGEVDLLIRTGGDFRISNFLLWQIAYAELFFTQTKWPEFSVAEYTKIINSVANRERRFGAIHSMPSLDESQQLAKQHINQI
jgi:undecaprenyl diphosphate synthase